MKAMIFAAGYGKRLKPLTDSRPKALIEVAGKPMLHWLVEKLINNGFKQIIINIHHHGDMFKEAIKKLHYNAEFIISDEQDCLLDTGGGLLKARKYLEGNEPFLVHNVDVISNVDLKEMFSFNLQQGGVATLATSKRKSSRYFLWHKNKMAGWLNTISGEKILVKETTEPLKKKAFSGIHVINPEIFKYIKDSGTFSINKIYLDIAKEQNIFSFDHDHNYWFDLGTVEKIKDAERIITKNPNIFVQ